jgi:hypothetical protein
VHDEILEACARGALRSTEDDEDGIEEDDQIRATYTEFLAGRPSLKSAGQQPAIINGDTALTSTRLPGGGVTVAARRQPDGTWRWIIDQLSALP